jgi:hypothetical protein
MGFIRTILVILILLIVVVGGYWAYATFTSKDPNGDKIWVQINTYMPGFAKDWSCDQIKSRGVSGPVESCSK